MNEEHFEQEIRKMLCQMNSTGKASAYILAHLVCKHIDPLKEDVMQIYPNADYGQAQEAVKKYLEANPLEHLM